MYYEMITSTEEKIIIYKNENILNSFMEKEDNTDYQKYLQWLAEGNKPEPWQP